MKKSFLLLLLPLLALASWAQPSGVKTAPVLAPTDITWTGSPQQLIVTAGVPADDYDVTYTGGQWRRYGYGDDRRLDDPAGIQYYVRATSDPAPVNGEIGNGSNGNQYRPAWSINTASGIFTDIAQSAVTAPGDYTIYYRIMRDNPTGSAAMPGSPYQTSDWVNLGTVTISKPTIDEMPYYVNGPTKNDLTYNDEEQELITAGTDFAGPYNQSGGGVLYVAKTTHALPTTEEQAAATSEIPKRKNAGTYYVYYKILKDGGYYTQDSPWYEVGVGGILIKKRQITADDFTVTYAKDLVYTGTAQELVTGITWTNNIDRTATLAPNGKVEYSVNEEAAVATPQGTNAGDYTVQVVITGDNNHIGFTTDIEEAVTVNIAKADLTVVQDPAGYANLVYNGADQQLLEKGVKLEFKGAAVPTSDYHVDYKIGDVTYGLYTDVLGKDAKDYAISYEITSLNANYNSPVGDGNLTVNIAKADWTVNAYATIADFTYDGAEHALLDPFVVADGFNGDKGVVTYNVTKDGAAFLTDVTAEADVKAQNVGEYEVTFAVAGTDNYNEVAATIAGTVIISKAKLHMGAQGLIVNYGDAVDYHDLIKFDDAEIPADEPLKGDPAALKDALVKFVSFEGATLDAGKPTALPTDVGGYNFTLEPIEGNYDFVNFIPDGGLTIKAIDATPANVAAATLTYNGADQELLEIVDATTLDGGKMLYYVGDAAPTVPDPVKDEIGLWSEDIPEAKAAGDYKVWYVVKADKNHNNGTPASYDVTIAKAPLSIVVDPQTKVYGSADPELTYTITTLLGADTEEEIGFAISRAAGEDVDDYAITATVDNDKDVTKNYDVTITNSKLTITQADLTITVADKEKVYGDPDPTFEASAGEGELKNGETLADLGIKFSRVEGENVNDYVINATVSAADNYNYTIVPGKLTIKKAPLTLTAADATKVYEEADPELTLAEEPAYKNGDDAEKIGLTITREAGEDVGEYEITPAATSGNYTYTVYTATFTITQQPVEPTAPTANVLTYNGQNQALIKAGSAKGSTVQYALGDGEFGDEIPEAKNAGTYTVKYKFTPGDNFSITDELASGEFDVKILQANVKFRMGKQEETYTGEAFEPVEGEAYTLAAGGFFVGDEDVLTFAFEEGFDATTACEEGRPFTKLVYTFKDDIANYTVDFQNEGLLIIKKAAPADFVAPAANDLTYNGLSQKLVTEGSVAKVDDKPLGTIMFSNKKDGEYTTAVPQGTDAKKYDVWFKVVGDANHNDTDPVQIAEAEIKPFELFPEMIKYETLQKVYNGEVQDFPMNLKVKLAADPKDPRTLVKDQDYTVKINDQAVKDVKIKNAGDYVYTFTGKGNYTGVISTTAKITKRELIAIVPDAVKTYDGTTAIEPEEFQCTDLELKLYGGLQVSNMAADDRIDLGGKTLSDFIAVPANAVNVGTYTDKLTIDLDAFPEQANYVITDVIPGSLTINKAKGIKIGFKTKTKVLDEFWPVTEEETTVFYYKSYGTADNLQVVPEDLKALEGELFDDPAYVATILDPSRDPGEVYNKDGYTFYLNFKKASSGTPLLTKINTFKNNYEYVTFGTTKFYITPFEGNIKVSIKSTDLVFDGKDHAGEYTWAEDLSNMVVIGLPAGKNKNEIFSELPTVKIKPNAGSDNKIRNAGDYNIIFEGGKSVNYDMDKIQLVQGSYLTIEPFEITPDMVTIADQQVKVGADANKDIKHDAFTFAEGALPVAEDANLFQVVAAPRFISGDKIVVAEKPESGLILVRKDNNNPEALNYTGYENGELFGYLSITGTADLLVLDDTKDIATLDRENTDVTFTNRSIRQDDWNVVCLPFDATIKQISDAFGYAAIDLLKKESVDGSMHFVVTTSGTVPAGEPFIVKPTSDPELDAKSNFVQVKFTGVTVKKFSDNPEPVKDSAGNKFCGTFKAQTTFFGEKFWYMSNSEWKQASKFTEANPVKLGAYRAYIETATAGARIFIEEPDGSITAINAIDLNNNTMDEGWYTVNGMKLNAAPTQKGTYIKDGKKVFVK